jgi:mono/diheme cytochrome c family protein
MLLWGGCGAPETVDTAAAATLATVQAEVFTPSCAFSTCHGDGGGSAGLSLLDGLAYGELVNAPAEGDAVSGTPPVGALRVVPGDPDGSYLLVKLGASGAFVGDRMPSADGLDDERFDLVRAWIEAGALDD